MDFSLALPSRYGAAERHASATHAAADAPREARPLLPMRPRFISGANNARVQGGRYYTGAFPMPPRHGIGALALHRTQRRPTEPPPIWVIGGLFYD